MRPTTAGLVKMPPSVLTRIKKIMRSDEDVGKLAQATPLMISKALEIFLENLVDQGCQDARNQQSAKLAPLNIKNVVKNTPKFDFLEDLVANIPDQDPGITASKNVIVKSKRKEAAPPANTAGTSSSTSSSPSGTSKREPNDDDDGDADFHDDEDPEVIPKKRVKREPKAPKAPKAPKEPRAPKAPKAPKVPKEPRAPRALKPLVKTVKLKGPKGPQSSADGGASESAPTSSAPSLSVSPIAARLSLPLPVPPGPPMSPHRSPHYEATKMALPTAPHPVLPSISTLPSPFHTGPRSPPPTIPPPNLKIATQPRVFSDRPSAHPFGAPSPNPGGAQWPSAPPPTAYPQSADGSRAGWAPPGVPFLQVGHALKVLEAVAESPAPQQAPNDEEDYDE